MIQEQYVSFETAKLLKEKGFNEELCYIYSKYGDLHRIIDTEYSVSTCDYEIKIRNSDYNDITQYKYNFLVTAPTQSLIMRWLREVHNLFIDISIIPHSTVTMEQKYYHYNIFKNRRGISKYERKEFYPTYEEACESAIKYCLENLI